MFKFTLDPDPPKVKRILIPAYELKFDCTYNIQKPSQKYNINKNETIRRKSSTRESLTFN